MTSENANSRLNLKKNNISIISSCVFDWRKKSFKSYETSPSNEIFWRDSKAQLPNEEPPKTEEKVARVLSVEVGIKLGIQSLQKLDQQGKLENTISFDN